MSDRLLVMGGVLAIITGVLIGHCDNGPEEGGGGERTTSLATAQIEEAEVECPADTKRVGERCQPLCGESQKFDAEKGECVSEVDCDWKMCELSVSLQAEIRATGGWQGSLTGSWERFTQSQKHLLLRKDKTEAQASCDAQMYWFAHAVYAAALLDLQLTEESEGKAITFISPKMVERAIKQTPYQRPTSPCDAK